MEIYGLDLEPVKAQTHIVLPLPSEVVMVVQLVRHSSYDTVQPDFWQDACHKLFPIMLESISRFQGCHVEPLYVPHFVPEAELFEGAGLHPFQEKWRLGDVSLTLQFFDPAKVNRPPIVALQTGVTVQNLVIANAGTIDPSCHSGVQVSDGVGRYFRATVGNIFATETGIWNRALLPLENEVLVKGRAALFGDDPDQEWAKFQAAGFEHHLEYIKIWDA